MASQQTLEEQICVKLSRSILLLRFQLNLIWMHSNFQAPKFVNLHFKFRFCLSPFTFHYFIPWVIIEKFKWFSGLIWRFVLRFWRFAAWKRKIYLDGWIFWLKNEHNEKLKFCIFPLIKNIYNELFLFHDFDPLFSHNRHGLVPPRGLRLNGIWYRKPSIHKLVIVFTFTSLSR